MFNFIYFPHNNNNFIKHKEIIVNIYLNGSQYRQNNTCIAAEILLSVVVSTKTAITLSLFLLQAILQINVWSFFMAVLSILIM